MTVISTMISSKLRLPKLFQYVSTLTRIYEQYDCSPKLQFTLQFTIQSYRVAACCTIGPVHSTGTISLPTTVVSAMLTRFNSANPTGNARPKDKHAVIKGPQTLVTAPN
jgi:hypothetical protein